jgi:mono/diheme cytochrome c family protein
MQPKLTPRSPAFRTTFTKEVPRADTTLLALALTGFLAATGCGDDDGAVLPSAPDAGGSLGDATEASDAATDASNASTSETQVVVADAGDDTSESAPITLGDAGPDGGPNGGNGDVDQDGVTVAGGDCNDFNDAVFPGANEIALDGVDSDCDGADAPKTTLVWSSEEDPESPNLIDALPIFDTNEDGEVSLAEFESQCAKSAKLVGDAGAGIVQFHASCAGTNSCRGMVLQTWGELYEHSCRGVNACAGWSCVETAADQDREGGEAFLDAHCGNCHGSKDGTFKVLVPPGEDVGTYVEDFWGKRSDDFLQSVIAFGISYTSEDGYRVSNMPGAYHLISRAEIDRLIATLRQLPLSSESLAVPGHLDHGETSSDTTDGASSSETGASGAGASDAGVPDAN